MFVHSLLPFFFCFLAQIVSVSSSPLVVERAAATCAAKDIATVKRTTPDAVYFCQWWQQEVRTVSPFMEFSATQVDTLCRCISPVTTGPKCRRKRKRSQIEERAEAITARSAASCSSEVSKQFTEPYRFCTFYTASPRTTSPFKAYTASALTSLCKCAITKPATTTSKKVSTTSKKITTSTQKATTTSKKVSTSTKPTTINKPVVTSTKKVTTSSTKKPTTTSTKKPTTTSTKKPTTSSTKKPTTTSATKPVTTSIKKVTSTSTQKPTVTSTKKPATTSSKVATSTTKKPTTTSVQKSTSSTKRASTSSKR